MTPVATISSYHAHIYFADAEERERAAKLRDAIGARFSVQLGRWHDVPIGPHARPMYQVAFATRECAAFVPWLMLNRLDLVILIHPNTRNPRRDHLTNSFWLGDVLPIMHPERLPEIELEELMDPVVPNTAPSIPP